MTQVFLYKNINNLELLDILEIEYGYILVESYDKNDVKINIDNKYNNTILHGKIIKYNMKIEDAVKNIENLNKYNLDLIWVNKLGGGLCKIYIIF